MFRFKTLFLVEMGLSPIVAAIAYLVPVATNWGAFKYIPAIIWFAIFVQCLFTFRCRGLCFLLGPPVAFLAIVAFLIAAPPRAATKPDRVESAFVIYVAFIVCEQSLSDNVTASDRSIRAVYVPVLTL